MRAAICAWFCALGSLLARADAPDVAIYAKAFNGYARTRLPDGTIKPETYVFAPGKRRDPMADPSLEKLPFVEVARTIAEPLRQKGYVPSFDPQRTDLMIFVYWGMTSGAEGGEYSPGHGVAQGASSQAQLGGQSSSNPQAGGANDGDASDLLLAEQSLMNQMRDQNNIKNAALLGYRENLQRSWDTPGFSILQDAEHELELDRYYVVLIAVDYSALVHKKGYQLRWDARFSVPARGHAFDQELPMMARAASRYFGDDLDRLVRASVPEGKVEVGTPRVVEPGSGQLKVER